MNLMDLIIKITVDQSGVDQGMDQAKKTVTGASDTMTARAVAVGTAMYDMGKKAATGLLNIGKFSMDVGMAFDTSMASVAAISGATGGELDALTEKAKEMGAQTKFSASESADAFTYMAMAGWKTGDMLDGIEGIMNLAAASGENLASVSDIVTDALTAFGLSAEDSGHFADVLAAASNSANTNVSMLGGSFKYVAPVAGALGYSIEDVSVALGLMANSGIKAEQAGTSMRSMLSRLAKPTKEVYAAFDRLGISAEDALTNADGSMKPLSETIGILREKMSGLSETEQASAAASIAGQEAMSGLLAIVNASESDYQKLTDAIANADGTAQGMADTMNDNLPGAITILKSAMEGLGIAIYENGSEALKIFVEKITEVVTKITEFVGNGGIEKLINGFQNLLPWIAGATTAIVTFKTASAISSVFEILTKAVDGQALSWAKLSAAMNTNPFVLIVTIILTLVSAFVTLILTNEEFRNKIVAAWNAVKDTISGVVAALKTFFTETIPNAVQTAFEWLKGIPEKMGEIGKDMVRGLWEGIKSMGTWLIEKFSNFVGSIVESVKGALGIHSPSRVFAGIGENMALGLGEGWDNEYGNIKRSIASGMDFGTASVDFGASGVAAIGNSIASGVGALASSGSGSIVINLTTELDGAVLARKMVPYNAAEALRSGV
uniref:Minor tail protein n=1 Tax=Siphoviridae sp. ctMRT7 TaxID=2827855 RepID=A0A8S5SSU6_9CAUD|nr:MAG TPA: minor tail protein [Siphoviridae sp. ctMRT7]